MTPSIGGCYIVGEGNDGTGKSTQINLLADYIKTEFKLNVYVMHEPSGAEIANQIRQIIIDGNLKRQPLTNLLLYTACRYETWVSEALPVLEQGGVVLSSRNYLSSQVYQGVAEGLGVDYVREITETFMDNRYINPDLLVVFEVSDEIRNQRIKQRGELDTPDIFESRDDEFQQLLNNGYKQVIATNEATSIDASRSIESIQSEFQDLATQTLRHTKLI